VRLAPKPARHISLLPPRSLLPPTTNTNKPMYGRPHTKIIRPSLPGLTETTSKVTQRKRGRKAETPKTNPYYSQTVSNSILLLLSDTKTTQPIPQGSDPSAFQYLPAPTDRQRKAQAPSIAEIDIQALYWQIVGSQWLIPRTLDPTHIPTGPARGPTYSRTLLAHWS